MPGELKGNLLACCDIEGRVCIVVIQFHAHVSETVHALWACNGADASFGASKPWADRTVIETQTECRCYLNLTFNAFNQTKYIRLARLRRHEVNQLDGSLSHSIVVSRTIVPSMYLRRTERIGAVGAIFQ